MRQRGDAGAAKEYGEREYKGGALERKKKEPEKTNENAERRRCNDDVVE